ncbi:hypothetical protein Y032_0128g1423 [Ancylostoma ceylanicum]|nr:hypothetical protein Y032_0128g1423 [Ancylostoma ceylanicum]
MDNFAKVESQKWKWRAITRKGKLTLDAEKKNVNVEWDTESDQDIASGLNYKGRAMELSDLSEYNGHLLSPDDKTGMLYEIKDGKEYRNENGDVVSEDPMWIKIITKRGEVRSKNWNRVFSRVRNEAGYPAPGYLTHEAVQWSEKLQQWLFLPRKASKTPYVESEDEKKGTNLLIKGTPDLKSFEVVRIGTEEVEHPDRGFSAFDFIPGTEDRLIAAIKSREVEGEDPESYITVFDVDGNVLMEDMQLDGNYKFEGLYFV